jgi:hypothetical protein
MAAWDNWHASEKQKRTAHITDHNLRDAIPDPTEEEFLMVLDPTRTQELDFFSDYVTE